MKVYILTNRVSYEGEDIKGVYLDYAKALEAKESGEADAVKWGYLIDINEYEVIE